MRHRRWFVWLAGVALLLLSIAGPIPSAFAQGCSGDVNDDGVVDGVDLAIVLGDWGMCPGAIESVSPLQGSHLGSTLITITGTKLAGTTAVTVGGAPCTNVTVLSPTTVQAVTPPGPAGSAAIAVTTPGGVILAPTPFAYFAVIVPSWATLLEVLPDPAVVTDPNLRAAITATGLAWRVRDTGTNIEMLLVPPGTFNMGCSPSNQYGCDPDENPVHAVTLTNAFYIGRYEVTQAQWTAKMGSNPSFFQGASYPDAANRPVEKVSWTTIQGFLTATGMRLPSEAEWEYAYRAGTTTAFHSMPQAPNGTNDDTLVGNIAWYLANSCSQTEVVGVKAPNALGLHDMAGNVLEWVNDWHSSTYYASSPAVNPPGPATGTQRVLRGGAWAFDSRPLRSSDRNSNSPSGVNNVFGFRVARTP